MQRGRFVLAVLVAGALGLHALGAAGPMLRIELSSYRQLTADIAALSGHLENPMLNMGLVAFGNLIGSPGLLGVDQDRPMRWALFPEGDGGQRNSWVMVLPVTEDGKAFLDSLGVSYEVTRDDGLIRRLRASRPVQSFREMSVRLLDGWVVASPSEPLVRRAADLLQTNAAAFSLTGLSGTLRVGIDVAAALPKARLRFEESARAADAVGEPPEGAAAAAEALRRLYVETLFGVLEQAGQVAFGLQFDAQGLTVYSRLDAWPETALAKLCAEAAPPPARLLALLPPEACGAYAGGTLGAFLRHGMDPDLEWTRKLLEIQGRMLGAGAVPQGAQTGPDPAALLAQMQSAWKGYGDAMVASFGPEGGSGRLVLFEAVTLSDAATVRETLAANLETANALYAAAGFPLRFARREDRAIGGVTVQVYGLDFEPAQEAGETGPGAPDLREAWESLRKRMGEKGDWMRRLVMELAVVDDLLLMTVGGAGSLDPFLGRLQAAPEAVWSARSRALFPEIRNHDQAVEFWLLKPIALTKLLVPVFDTQGFLAEIVAGLPDEGEGLGGLTMTAPGTVMGAFRTGAPCLTAIARSSAFVQRLNAGRRGRGTGRPGETPPGDPVEVVLPED